MWIRSQDLFTLVKCERLYVRQCASDSFDVIGDGITLGSYSTELKALKVMDELQEEAWVEKKTYVYQMPADEDVEV